MKNLTWQNPEQLFVAQVLINKVKSKCCGIKVAVFKFEEGKVVMLPVESNEFRGERLNRATWSQLVWLKSFGVNKAVLIDEKDANFLLKKYVTDYFSNH